MKAKFILLPVAPYDTQNMSDLFLLYVFVVVEIGPFCPPGTGGTSAQQKICLCKQKDQKLFVWIWSTLCDRLYDRGSTLTLPPSQHSPRDRGLCSPHWRRCGGVLWLVAAAAGGIYPPAFLLLCLHHRWVSENMSLCTGHSLCIGIVFKSKG